ncbi:helix-turn-helix transcriptional regulator [Streptomyces sp. NBC_00557]|uniref:helix-turn-helix transcriptional regulator n=1 Tax=Streptomyces sp. NBC_00557 TaxID=2975776 RepID=UPI002E81C4B1|nr:helix-turn-helix transcriptional regulator [Streptomyces sp. NBC_00557]WUC39787.1 helix-turn-helix domain-containing protein [Streptomyces sp. NBC_00557]
MPDWVLTRRREIGERIRVARSAARLSQVELGERVGRDHKTVHRYETAQTAPNLTDLLLIAEALSMPCPASWNEKPRPSASGGADERGRMGAPGVQTASV